MANVRLFKLHYNRGTPNVKIDFVYFLNTTVVVPVGRCFTIHRKYIATADNIVKVCDGQNLYIY